MEYNEVPGAFPDEVPEFAPIRCKTCGHQDLFHLHVFDRDRLSFYGKCSQGLCSCRSFIPTSFNPEEAPE